MEWKRVSTYDGGYVYVNEFGERSERFPFAKEYEGGSALVKTKKLFRYRDLDGNLSEEFPHASDYNKDGFAMVYTGDGKFLYRDIAGNLTKEKTQVGYDLKSYLNGELTVAEMPREDFENDKALEYIVNREEKEAEKALLKGGKAEEIETSLNVTLEMINQKSILAKLKTERDNMFGKIGN